MERNQAATAAADLLAQPAKESSPGSTLSVKPGNDWESQQLVELMAQMAAHYPHQDIGPAAESFLFDMQRLRVKHGFRAVETALLTLRIKPSQKFFPHPTEVAQELEAMAAKTENYHKFQADPNCECRKIQKGWTWVIDKDGDRVMGRCPCYRLHAGMRADSVDTKARAAGA